MLEVKENGAEVIVKRLRRRLCEAGFRLWKLKVVEGKGEEFVEKRLGYFQIAHQTSIVKQVYARWKGFVKGHLVAKMAMKRMYNKLDQGLMERGYFRWIEFAKIKKEEELEGKKQTLINDV